MDYQLCAEEFYNESLNEEDYICDQYIDFENISWPGNPEWRQYSFIDYIMMLAYVVIIVGGFFGNVSVILTVICNKSMRTTINLYVINLAVSDAIVCVICVIPHAMLALTTGGNYIFGRFMCRIDTFSKMTCLISSVLTLSAISCDRSMAILFPLRVRVTKHRSSILISIIWIISVIVSLPLLIFKEYSTTKFEDGESHRCSLQWPEGKEYYDESTDSYETDRTLGHIFTTVTTITLFFLPVITMFISYFLILFRLGTSKLPGEQNESNVGIHNRARKKVNKMIFVVLVAFVVCWSPSEFIVLFITFRSKSSPTVPEGFTDFTWEKFLIFAELLAYANSFINPIIYGWFNKTFREGFCILLRCKCLRTKCEASGTAYRSRVGNSSHLQNSFQSMSTALSSLGSQTQAFLNRANPRRTTHQAELQKTSAV